MRKCVTVLSICCLALVCAAKEEPSISSKRVNSVLRKALQVDPFHRAA